LTVASASVGGYLTNLAGCFRRHEFWYVFGWLMPLGVWRMRSLPREWVVASTVTAPGALAGRVDFRRGQRGSSDVLGSRPDAELVGRDVDREARGN
ncbi:MAG TPA: hypothetical protein VLU47_02340, partial [Blastocatellia bacterium]|nr:hypothetical protein [Blastocatellia bacterium]